MNTLDPCGHGTDCFKPGKTFDFILSVVRVTLPAAMLVAATAFFTMPYTLGHHPGEQGVNEPAFARHMT